jgi:hypothetical protein
MRESAYNAKTTTKKEVALALAAIALVLSASLFVMPVQQAAAVEPSHANIQTRLDLARGFVDSIYKNAYNAEVDTSSEAVLAEYPSIPIWIVHSDGRRIAAGEDVNVKLDIKTSYIDAYSETGTDTIQYQIRFRTVDIFGSVWDKVPLLLVTVDYDYGAGRNAQVTVKNQLWDSNSQVSWADVYLGSTYLGRASSSNVGTTWTYTSSAAFSNDPFFRSHRYIERHGTQLGMEYYNIYDSTRATALATRLGNQGYTLHKDIYAPMFGSSASLPNNYLYESGSTGVYRDCYTEPAKHDRSYQYHSKVCNNVDLYIYNSANSNWLVPMLWAMHLLNKGVGPDTPVYDGRNTRSPRQVARMAESHWIADYGIASPSSGTVASGVRTAAFLALETKLGYGYGDTTSRTYADKAASALLNPQVGSSGQVTRENEDGSSTTFTRPLFKGGFLTAWNGFNMVAKRSILQQIADWFNQPDEAPDVKPSNAEATITVAQALRVYDCYVNGYNCPNTP